MIVQNVISGKLFEVSWGLKNLFSIFGKAFMIVAKIETAVNSFWKCGIYPYNSGIFSASDFAVVASNNEICSSSSNLNNEGILHNLYLDFF